MEWLSEGFTLCFLGILVFQSVVAGVQTVPLSIIVLRAAAIMLVAMAILSFFTGAKTSVIPMKICPWIKITVAVFFWMGSIF